MTRLNASVWIASALTLAGMPSPAPAGPRDEVLRVTPPDAALVLVVQNARDHAAAVAGSPFAEWVPTSKVGKPLAIADHVKQFRDAGRPLFDALGTTPDELLADVIGDAVVFAYSPAPAGDPKGERAVVLVRPRKPETLARLVGRLDELQTGNEVKAVVKRDHRGAAYFERQKAGGGEFYCFCGPVFAFSVVEADIQSVLDRDRDAPREVGSELVAKMTKLGAADAAAALLINPRRLDADVRAKIAAAAPDEKPFLEAFGDVWKALDAAAVTVSLGPGVEAAVALDFRPGELTPAARAWLTGGRSPPALAAAIPAAALASASARFRAGEAVAAVRSLLPEKGRRALDAALGDSLGAVVGRGRLPLVLDAIGPDWALWAEPPPAGGGFLPVVVGAVRVSADGPRGADAARALERAVAFGFQAAQVAYNATHTDQIEVIETPDGGATVTSLAGDAAFPPGVRPSFAFKGGYLVASSSPDAVKRFRAPAAGDAATGEVVAARFSAAAAREYLLKHRTALAGFAAKIGRGNEADLLTQLDQFTDAIEPIDQVEVTTRGTDSGVRVAVRVKPVKPLK